MIFKQETVCIFTIDYYFDIIIKIILEVRNMSKYCPKCKMNFTDSFNECVYCGSILLHGTIESEEKYQPEEQDIFKMSDEEILKKYDSYKKNIEEQTGTILSDKEFIIGLQNAKRETLLKQSTLDNNIAKNNKNNLITCPYCKSSNIKKITTSSKVAHTALFGIFSISRNSKNFHCNQCSADF